MKPHLVQRASGVLLLVYLFLHVLTVRKLAEGEAAFNAAVATFRHPLFHLLEVALLGTVILHALNGVRITILDLGADASRQHRYWIWSLGAGALLFLLGAIPMLVYRRW